MFVVCTGLAEADEYGTVEDSIMVFGPFESEQAANEWAKGFFSQECDYWVVPLHQQRK